MGNVATKEQGASRRNSATTTSSRNRPHGRKDKRKQKSAPQYLTLDPSETVDGGYLQPHGVYPGPHDFNYKIVRQLIIDRKLAPFYKGLQEYNKNWSERQLLAVIRGLPVPPDDQHSSNGDSVSSASVDSSTSESTKNIKEFEPSSAPTYDSSIPFPSFESASSASLASLSSPTTPQSRTRANTSSRYTPIAAEPHSSRTPPEILPYRNVLECPICFMYYPASINKTRCCEQPICTECFVAIKRADPHPPHESESEDEAAAERRKKDIIGIISEPACCPFCMMPDFGVTFVAPGYRSGISPNNTGRRHATPLSLFSNSSTATLTSKTLESNSGGGSVGSSSNNGTALGVRRGSLPATAPEVITTDEIRPDWAMKLASARARAARKSAAATAIHNSAFNEFSGANGSSSSSTHDVGTSSRSDRHKNRSGSLSKLIRGHKHKSVTTTD